MARPIITRSTAVLFLLWLGAVGYADESGLALKAQAAISVDVDTSEIIFAKNINRRMYPASTTKLLTAILLAQNKQKQDLLTYSKNAKKTHPFILNLPVDDRLSAVSAMDALLLYSANDIAVVIAENVSGSTTAFVQEMNNLAKRSNLASSNFGNPNGLHQEQHYTTAYDLSILGRSLYRYPWIMQTMAKKSSTVTSESGVRIHVSNRNKLAGLEGCVGGKTGFTSEAGKCLVALYEREGRRIAGVVLNAGATLLDDTVFQDMQTLIQYSYSAKKQAILSPNDLIAKVTVPVDLLPLLGPRRELIIPLVIKEEVRVYKTEEPHRLHYETDAIDPWRLSLAASAGVLILNQKETETRFDLYPLLAWQDILRKNYVFYVAALAGLLLIFTAAVIVVRLVTRRRHGSASKNA